MKALSGYAEWFWLIAVNIKPVENRDWPLPRKILLPERIYLHASKTKTPIDECNFITKHLTTEKYEQYRRVDFDKLRGCIIGETTLVKQIKKHTENHRSDYGMGGIFSIADEVAELKYMEREYPEYFSEWFFGEFGFVVKDGKLYDKPIPMKGHLGFWEVNLPEGTNVRSQA